MCVLPHLFTSLDVWFSALELEDEFNIPLSVRYGVLLSQRLSEVSDREQTVNLLDMVGAEDGHYQLGRTKVLYLQQHTEGADGKL